MTGDAALPAFAEGVFSGRGATTRLLGNRFGHDGIELPRRGTLYSYTVVRMKPPFGLPAPYAVGYVDFAGVDLRVFMLLDPDVIGTLRIGMKLEITSGPLGIDLSGHPCIRPYFRAVVPPS